jgi:hypothetical protein
MNYKNTPILFDISWMITFVSLIILPHFYPDLKYGPLHTIFFVFIGAPFIFSNALKEVSYVARAMYWIAINIMKPKTKYNHVITGFFLIFIGLLPIDKPTLSEKEFFEKVNHSYEFWIAIVIALLFNVLIGIYTARNHKKYNNSLE